MFPEPLLSANARKSICSQIGRTGKQLVRGCLRELEKKDKALLKGFDF